MLPHLDQKFLFEKSIAELEPDETYSERLAFLSGYELPVAHCPSSPDKATNVENQGKYTADYYGVTGPIGVAQSSDGAKTYNYRALDPVPPGGNVALDGMFSPDQSGQFSIGRGSKDALDGAAETLAFGEISRLALTSAGGLIPRGGWAFGASRQSGSNDSLDILYSAKSVEFQINKGDGIANNISFASTHAGGANFAFVDASVTFLKETIDIDVLKTIASTNHLEAPESLDPQ